MITVNELVRLTVGEMHIYDGQDEPLIVNCNRDDAIKNVEESVYDNKTVMYMGCMANNKKQWLSVKVEGN